MISFKLLTAAAQNLAQAVYELGQIQDYRGQKEFKFIHNVWCVLIRLFFILQFVCPPLHEAVKPQAALLKI